MDAYVEVTDSAGKMERYPIEGAQVTLGKSGTAGVSLPTANELELEHLLIAPRGREGCWVSTSQGAATPTTLRGKPFTSAVVKWNSELVIGRLRIRLTNKKPKAKGGDGGPSKVVILGGIGIIAMVGWLLLSPNDDLPTAPTGVEPPDLFAGLDVTCAGDGTPEERAQAAEYNGHVTGDRYRYSSEDGVTAVEYFRQASTCFQEAGQAAEGQEVTRVADELQEAIEADYAGLRLNLHHALQVQDWRTSQRNLENLVDLTTRLTDDPYAQWLDQTLRIVRARYLQEQQAAAQQQ